MKRYQISKLRVVIIFVFMLTNACTATIPSPTITATTSPTNTPSGPTATPPLPKIYDVSVKIINGNKIINGESYMKNSRGDRGIIVPNNCSLDYGCWNWTVRFYNSSGWSINIYGYGQFIVCPDGRSFSTNGHIKMNLEVPAHGEADYKRKYDFSEPEYREHCVIQDTYLYKFTDPISIDPFKDYSYQQLPSTSVYLWPGK